MAIVTDIQNELTSAIESVLGSSWSALTHVYELEKNADRIRKQGYGVRPLQAISTSGVTNFYTMSQTMEVILTDTIPSQSDDSDKEASFKTLFDKADDILKNILGGKLNQPSFILVIHNPEISQPEVFEEESFVALRVRLDVVYRSGALV